MIGKLVRRMLTAQTLSALTVSLCLLIDNMMVGRFLGVGALAANSLASPVLLIVAGFSSLMAAGVQVACSKSLGRGAREETDSCYSTAVVTGLAFALAFALAVFFLRVPIARLTGADEEILLRDTSGYMAGFVIGAPATMLCLILIPFLQIAGQSSLLIAAVLSMTVADIGLDLLNVFVLKWGMFGMGLASALSYYAALAIAAAYFLNKKKCVFRFSLSRVHLRKMKEILAGGAPSLAGMAASVLVVFAINRILLGTGENGERMVAVYAVVSAIGNASNCVSTGSSGVSLTLAGIFYNEEDRTSLREAFRQILCCAPVFGAGMALLLMVFAPNIVSLFMADAGAGADTAAFALRCFAPGIIPCCLNNAFRSGYQGTDRVRLMEIISLAECFALPVCAALAGRGIAGADGVWWFFTAAEALALAGILAMVWIRKRKATLRADDLLLLSDSFGVPAEDLMEKNIRGMDDVMDASRAAEEFCRSRGGDGRLCAHLALCIEEMGSNIVNYGFGDGKKHSSSVRLQHKDGKWTLRFRDDCTAFDPVSHIPEDNGEKGVGIRLTMRMADEARYTYSMNLNNLVLILNDAGKAA